ncbi:aminoglycoside 3'-phosphotransferase-1 [Sphingomonas sp. BE138]|uniref:APH(3') family aminoglycoside O-phosphotransferase n=1 Tax=Sphingomonas sp. BE138 TaxID=2817845 RepID=UPI0028668D37|nr:APH(3') family aminoglycoside O-phosphotransferase [Sphingomonas sp. BE138]MDR6789607.1 aminoglycoside 3'-phosphotransferase-1 [Sphingomonas sp. BE138]
MPIPLPPAWRERLAGATWEREPEGESGGVIHRLAAPGGDAMFLKFGEGPVAEAVADEAIRLRWLQGRVPAARLISAVVEEDAAWLLTAAVPGRTGDGWLADRPQMLASIITGFAAFVRALHALPVDDCPFDAGAGIRLAAARRNVAAGVVDEDDFDDEHQGWSAARVLAEAEALRHAATDRVVTHGDLSLGNLLFDAAGVLTGCIDVGRLGVADRYQDIAIFWQNLADYGAAAQAAFLDEIGIGSPDTPRLRFHRLLDELF